MVISSSSNVLYANEAAHHFLERLNHAENGDPNNGALPVSIASLCDEFFKTLESRTTNDDWKSLEARRRVVGQDQRLLLQVFGLPKQLGMQRARVVITMRDITRP
jgi:hypothetical protein